MIREDCRHYNRVNAHHYYLQRSFFSSGPYCFYHDKPFDKTGLNGCDGCFHYERSPTINNTKKIHQFPEGENCVSMLKYNGVVFIATNKRIYIVENDKVIPLEIAL